MLFKVYHSLDLAPSSLESYKPHNGRVPTCRLTNLVPALSEGSFPSFPVHQPSFVERELTSSSITSFGASFAVLHSTCTLPSNFTSSDLRIYDES
jgi:hypothetical protein